MQNAVFILWGRLEVAEQAEQTLGYQKVWREVNVATCQLGPEERAQIFGSTAIGVYRLANLSQGRFAALMIRACELTKNFGTISAVQGISFAVAEGEIFAFLGPNGAGKTTTIKMLTTLLKPTSGSVELDGLNPATQQHEARKRFGIVFQDSSTDDDLTAYENMDFHGVLYKVPKRIRAERIEELLKLFELWDRRDHQVKHFSGGMRRRLEIARGFLHTPKILFLDEPTLGLDPQTRNQLWSRVKRLNETESVTVFLTTHYMEEAERVAHRIAIMDHGRIIAQGTSAQLKDQTGADSLEKAFLALTGTSIREEEGGSIVRMRRMAKLFRR